MARAAQAGEQAASAESGLLVALSAADISVAYADTSSGTPNFPFPWDNAPNTLLLGGGAPLNAGAIRIDNPSGAPQAVERVTVDLQRPGPVISLWTNFTIPAGGAVILTQTAPGNFNTSDYPIVPCGGTIAAGDTRVPKITVRMSGVDQIFLDTAHVLDTGGFDLSCRGNESLGWRRLGTTGIANPVEHLVLTPDSASLAGGAPHTAQARLTDASDQPLANAAVAFRILSGPNAGRTGQDITDSQGYARFTYSSDIQGGDLLQASVTNASGAAIQSNQATITWISAACISPAQPPSPGATTLVYLGPLSGQYSDPLTLAALLANSSGTALSGRSLTFNFGGQPLGAVTDGAGVARITVTPAAPGPVSLTVSFAGDGSNSAATVSQVITIDREDTVARYTAKTLLGTAVPQPVSAKLVDADSQAPLAGKTLTFQVGTVTATAVTDATGVASTNITLGPAETSGPTSMKVSFAGDAFYKPSFQGTAVTIYLSTSFVVWGGNTNGLKLGDRVNFWGSQWPQQVIQGDYVAQGDFKGLADPVDQIHICQPTATVSSLTNACWSSKAGQSWPPPLTVPAYIEVIVSTVVVKRTGLIYGNIAAATVVKVEPGYGPDPGKQGWGTLVAVIEDTNVFPPRAALSATQTQPAAVLPSEPFTVTTSLNNASTTSATSALLNETFDGVQPATGSFNFGTIGGGATVSTSFQETAPGVSIRQAGESSVDYLARLGSLNGRVFTSTGQVTFSDPAGQQYLPVDVTSASILQLPILSLALTGPSSISPGASIPYTATVTNFGSAAASSATILLTLPDGSTQSIAVTNLSPGSSFAANVSFTQTALAPKSPAETTAQYLARLALSDGRLLTAAASVTWRDARANNYGEVGQQIFTSTVRVPILTVTPPASQTLIPGQNATLSFTVQNTGGCTATLANLKVTNPDGSITTAPAFPLAGGQSTVVSTQWRVPAVPAREVDETGESEASYLARLTALDNSTLNFTAALDWSDPSLALYGPTTTPATATEVLPIVTLALTAPATAQSGNSINYTVTATNIGHANSPGVILVVTKPDTSVVQPIVGSLPPNGTFQTSIPFAIPVTQPTGTITGRAVVSWNDGNQNAYGTFTAAANTSVTNPGPAPGGTLLLAPSSAGPNVTGTTQNFTATLKDAANAPVANATVTLTVTGANARTATATTDASGVASFSYVGSTAGNDSVQAGVPGLVSNTAAVSWVTPVQAVSTTTLLGRFFPNPTNAGAFVITPDQTPVFSQTFPTINFNPPAGTVPGNTSGVGVNTRPFTNVTTDLNGNFTGTIIAQGNGVQAGVGTLNTFQAVFTGTLTIASAGNVVFNFFTDDGFILGIGNGATRVSGVNNNPPASGRTAFENFPVMGANNVPTAPAAATITVNFPAAGSYPYELDYSECCSGQLVLTMTTSTPQGSKGVAPTGSITLSPNTVASKNTGLTQTFTALATDASGVPQVNLGVALIVNGPNASELTATTDATGRATFTYAGVNAGNDTAQAVTNIGGMGAFSNIVTVPWTVPPGGSQITSSFSPGWLGSPLPFTVVTGRLAIQLASGLSVTSGIVDFWPTSNPSDVRVLNANASGGGGATLATFDATLLANGEYMVRLRGTLSNGTQQTSLLPLNVTGENKVGRFTATVTDLTVPLAGIPITIGRTYDSLERGKVADFGYGWLLSIGGPRLGVNSRKDVSFTINGRRMTFFFTPQSGPFPFPFFFSPRYTPEAGAFGSLTGDGCGLLIQSQGVFTCFLDYNPYQPTTYTYTDAAGRVYVIGADGSLKSTRDLNGNTLTFTPNGITSTAGNLTVPFVRDGQGRITQVTDPNGNTYRYNYDASGNLASVQFPSITAPASYTYNADHLLTGEADPRGNSGSTTYYPDGRLQSITDAANQTTSFAYNPATNTTTATNPDGGAESTQKDALGNVIKRVDGLNRATNFTYDANRNLLTQTDPLGKITTYTYNSSGFPTSFKDPLNNVWSAAYNQVGRLTSVTNPLNQTQTVTYDGNFNIATIADTLGQVAAFTYNSQGLPLTFRDARNNAASYAYDQFGNRTGHTDPLGRTTVSVYDSMGRLTSQTDPRNSAAQYGYDALGRRTSMTDALNHVTRYEYDNNGNKTAEVDALNRRTTYSYDNVNRMTQIAYPDSTTRSYTYDFRGNKLTETDQLGRVTKYVYDQAGQLTSVTSAFGTANAATTSYTYDGNGRKLTEKDPRGKTSAYTYDAAGRLTSVKDPLGRVVSYGYDAGGQRISKTDPKNRITTYAYDARGRHVATTTPDGKTRSQTYGGLGLALTVTDEENRTTTFGYDAGGQFISVRDALNNITTYGYDLAGNRTSQTDANNRTTVCAYDALNRLTSRTLPLGQTESYTYDAVGNRLTRTDPNGKTTTYGYSSMNRLLSRTPDSSFGASAVTFTYTLTGQRASMTDTSGTTTYIYTNRDQVASKTTPQGQLSYSYDAAGNAASVVSSNVNGTNVSYGYDDAGQLKTVTDNWTGGTTSYTYDATGQLSSAQYPNGVTHSYAYDNRDRPTSLGVNGPGGVIAGYGQTFSFSGRKQTISEAGGRTVNYGYDAIYRLLNETIGGDPASANNGGLQYALDAVGNRLSLASTLAALPSQSRTYDANDRASGDTFDNNGNTVSSGGHTFVYDFEDRLTQYDTAVATIYDGDGRRVARSEGGVTIRYLIDDVNPTGYTQIAEETLNGAVIRQYTYGPMRISQRSLIAANNWQLSYYGYEGGGSVRKLTDPAGAVTDTYAYDAFGNTVARTGSTLNEFQYRGERYDATLGMYHLRARYYRPQIGRFLTQDPHEGENERPLSLHKYLYAHADPANKMDPTGLSAATENGLLSQFSITFGHGARHLVGTGLTQAEVEAAIAEAIREIAATGQIAGPFWAYLEVRGIGIIYRVYIVTAAWLNVGTYTVR